MSNTSPTLTPRKITARSVPAPRLSVLLYLRCSKRISLDNYVLYNKVLYIKYTYYVKNKYLYNPVYRWYSETKLY